MSLYAIGDLHLSLSEDVDKPMDAFGPLWDNHIARLEANWREMITDEDTVIIPGDISWGLKFSEAEPDLQWIDSLPGKKVIFKGNHDLWWAGINRLNTLYDSITFVQNKAYYAEGVYFCGTRGWTTPDSDEFKEEDEKIYKRELLRLQASLDDAVAQMEERPGKIMGVLHFPPVVKVLSFSGFQQLFADYGVEEVIYGHVHGEDGFRNTIKGNYHGVNYSLVSCDYLRCRPIQIG
ncbi:MAG: metallophosphoesterase [Eubacterium sp.]|nr:metallophosphoesterase [Candidatus Colimonas fimequi]